MQSGLAGPNGSTVTLYLNSNGNWDCESSGKPLPPALCSMRGLGSLTITATNNTAAGRDLA